MLIYKMTSLEKLVSPEEMRFLFRSHTIDEICQILQERFPNNKGLSRASVKRYCSRHSISKNNTMKEREAEQVIMKAVMEVNLFCRSL